MPSRSYRLLVVGCALSWFLVGLHLPALHAMIHHGGEPHLLALVITTLLASAGAVGLWALLRVPRGWPTRSSAEAS